MIPVKGKIGIRGAKPKAVQIAPETMAPPTVSPQAPITIEVKDVRGNILGTLRADYRTFSTGSKGYFMSGKIPGIGADRLQISGSVVIIGSKNQ